ncbi:hypothetical protein K458DRAFT_320357, partial [Lentithecium fluviatile CBS 122367]
MVAKTPYPCKPLTPGEIRILTLLPGSWMDPVVCELKNVPFEKARAEGYTALSYCWGPPSQPRYIVVVNNHYMAVGGQLFDALVYLRWTREPRDFWIDAICIRQDDNDEKSLQLPVMRDIYAFAKRVDVWLGLEADDSGYVLRAINEEDGEAQGQLKFVTSATKLLQRPVFSRVW